MASEYILIIILVLFLEVMTIVSATNVRIVLLAEKLQPEVYEWFSDSIEYLSSISAEESSVEGGTVFLDRDNEEDSFKMFCSEVSKGMTVLLDMTWSPWSKITDLMSDYGIPVVAADLGEGMPTLEALLQLLMLKNATEAVLIFQKENVMEHVLYRILGSSVLRILALHDFGNRVEQLRNLRPAPGQFVIFGSTTYLQDTYKMAAQTNLLALPDRWILASTDLMMSRLDVSVLKTNASLVGLVTRTGCLLLNMPDSCSDQVDTVLMNSLLMGKILKQLLDSIMVSNFQQLKPECNISPPEVKMENRSQVREFFTNLQMKVSKEEPLLYWDERRRGLYFRAELTVQVGGSEGLRTAARWYTDESIKTVPQVKIQSPRRFLRVGTTMAIPWTYPKLDSEGNPVLNDNKEQIYEGYCIDLIAKLAEVMNFDYEIVVPKEGGFGVKMKNGTWNGLIGDLAKGDTDIAVAATIMTSQREEVVDFVAPYFDQTGLSIVIRKPMRKTSLFKFMTVLRVEVWLSIVGALTMTAILLTLLDKYSPYSARNNKEAYPYPCREFTLKESLWFALTSFTPQGGGEAPKALSSRALVAAYWLFVVLMLATFTANLAAFLTVERMQSPVSSLEQLARQSRINYTVVEGGMAHQYFINMKNAEDTLYRVWKEITLNASSDELQYQVWDYPVREQYGHILLAINSSMPLSSADEGFKKVNEQTEADFAFIHDSSEIKYRVMRNCNLTIVGEVFGERPYAVAVQQGSRIQEELSRAILQLQKDRYLDSLTTKYWNTSCVDNDDSEGITLDSLGGVFIATLFGLVLALVTLVWEVFYYKRKERVQPTTKVSAVKTNKFVERWANKGKETKKFKGAVKRVTIGDTFKPVKDKRKPKISFINVEPKLDWNP